MGVILFILLSGVPPFEGKDDQEILESVATGNLEFKNELWKGVSFGAKKMVRRMLERDIKKRVSIEEAFEDEWFKEKRASNKAGTVSTKKNK